ncbi:hypothetical protein EXU34_04360 [Alteromonas sp. ZYF713]|nr:hypothetical protein [Alteromonas sp. ZYF713]
MTAAAIDKLIQQPPHHSLGFILAGGSSRRMGSDKAQLKVGQHTMLDIAADVLHAAAVNQHFVIGGAAADLVEQQSGQGPASAICDVLARFSAAEDSQRLALFMPVDMPRLSVFSINTLLDCARRNQQTVYYSAHYLPLVIPVNTHSQESARRLIAADSSPSVRKLLASLHAQPVAFSGKAGELVNINRPEELAELRSGV